MTLKTDGRSLIPNKCHFVRARVAGGRRVFRIVVGLSRYQPLKSSFLCGGKTAKNCCQQRDELIRKGR
jgi:hypothetical protein